MYGRWLSPDPAGLRAVTLVQPQSWNRYAYVSNAPLTASDPLGLCPIPSAYNQGATETEEHYLQRVLRLLRCAYGGPAFHDPGWSGFPLCGVDPFCHMGPFDTPIANEKNYEPEVHDDGTKWVPDLSSPDFWRTNVSNSDIGKLGIIPGFSTGTFGFKYQSGASFQNTPSFPNHDTIGLPSGENPPMVPLTPLPPVTPIPDNPPPGYIWR